MFSHMVALQLKEKQIVGFDVIHLHLTLEHMLNCPWFKSCQLTGFSAQSAMTRDTLIAFSVISHHYWCQMLYEIQRNKMVKFQLN